MPIAKFDPKTGTLTFGPEAMKLSKEDAGKVAQHERLHLLYGKVEGEALRQAHLKVCKFEASHGVGSPTWSEFAAQATAVRSQRPVNVRPVARPCFGDWPLNSAMEKKS